MVATNAFGMGIDKSNVRYVLHYNMPQSIEYYYQEAGRAGRDGEEAECVLFFSKQDIMINKQLLNHKAYGATEKFRTSKERKPKTEPNDPITVRQIKCLRQFILNYFGEDAPCTCEKCSNCVVIEEETEQNYIKTGSAKKRLELADLTPEGQELFEQAQGCRSELAASQNVHHLSSVRINFKRYVC